MRIPFQELHETFHSILLKLGFSEKKSSLCARIFAENSRDGVYSHGLNRFPVFVRSVKENQIDIHAEPEKQEELGVMEFWDGNLAPGMYTASLAMERAIAI